MIAAPTGTKGPGVFPRVSLSARVNWACALHPDSTEFLRIVKVWFHPGCVMRCTPAQINGCYVARNDAAPFGLNGDDAMSVKQPSVSPSLSPSPEMGEAWEVTGTNPAGCSPRGRVGRVHTGRAMRCVRLFPESARTQSLTPLPQ